MNKRKVTRFLAHSVHLFFLLLYIPDETPSEFAFIDI